MSDEAQEITIEEFLALLPKVDNILTFAIAGREFRFEAPVSFEGMAELFSRADKFAATMDRLPEGEMKQFAVSKPMAREIGVMCATIQSPAWKELDFMKLSHKSGVVYSTIRSRFESWLQQLVGLQVATEVVDEKKDLSGPETGLN